MIGINWRDAKTDPPTIKDQVRDGKVVYCDGTGKVRDGYHREVPQWAKLWTTCGEWREFLEQTFSKSLNPVQPDGSGGCETIRGLRNYSFDPPTKSDANSEGKVVLFWKDGSCGSWAWDKSWSADKPVFWCRSDEFHRIKESLLRIATSRTESTLNPPDSQWVYASERWPTDLDGQHVLWMADSWSQPGVHPVYAFSQASHCYRHNLRWCRIPPCPDPPKRELPAKAPESFPAFVTLRNGWVATIFCLFRNGELIGCCGPKPASADIPKRWDSDGMADDKEHDIVHVGGWLSKEELEALKNG